MRVTTVSGAVATAYCTGDVQDDGSAGSIPVLPFNLGPFCVGTELRLSSEAVRGSIPLRITSGQSTATPDSRLGEAKGTSPRRPTTPEVTMVLAQGAAIVYTEGMESSSLSGTTLRCLL